MMPSSINIYYERGTIQRIIESLYKGGFCIYDKDGYTPRFSKPLASIYCEQFEDTKSLADFLEKMAKQMN